MTNKKILIIGALPFFINRQSRSFDSYFHNMKRENLIQIFSSPQIPQKGHCNKLCQITDLTLIKRRFKKCDEIYYEYDGLKEQENAEEYVENKKILRFGKKKNFLKRLIRNIIWKDKYWRTDKLEEWVDSFAPDLIFIGWSGDIYILKIALFFSKKYNIPIISDIGDDYIFNNYKKTFFGNKYYKLYMHYVNLILLNKRNKEIYIDDKIRDVYNNHFQKQGITVHVASENQNFNKFKTTCSKDIKKICYFGNLGYDRYNSIITFANEIKDIIPDLTIDVFSGNASQTIQKKFNLCKNINFKGKVPYSDLKKKYDFYDAVLLVESLDNKKSILDVRYSLSTKVGDSLGCGLPIISVGSTETGMMDYLIRKKCSLSFTSKDDIKSKMKYYITTNYDLGEIEKNAYCAFNKDFSKKRSCELFERLVYECK